MTKSASGEDYPVAGLSRRGFLAGVSGLALGLGLSREALGQALATVRGAGDIRTSLLQTIKFSSRPVRGQYRTLLSAPGEATITRLDIVGREASAQRITSRRSLFYFAHLSDLHLIDAQTPARMEPFVGLAKSTFSDAFRPQETLSTQVLAAMIAAVRDATTSPITGAPLAAAVNTGDSADMMNDLETRWYINLLDGGTITPNSGTPGAYDGVQVWQDATYAYHPDDPSQDPYGEYGFPQLPDLLTTTVSQQVSSPGLPVPWYAVYGNHDAMFMGTLPVTSQLRSWAVGNRKAATWETLAGTSQAALASQPSALQRLANTLRSNLGLLPGLHAITPDPGRRMLERTEFMQAHLDSPTLPGPVGHGFTPANVATGQTWWKADPSPYIRLFGLDTCNTTMGADGGVPQEQFEWLTAELDAAQAQGVLCIVLSHHNSLTLENDAQPVIGGQRIVHSEEFIAALLDRPSCIAWINGHTHINTINAHSAPTGVGGFWEITTASAIDFPQQQQLIEIVDNRDGTLSLFVTALDHAGDPTWTQGDFTPLGLASLSREFAANDWVQNPPMRMGSPLDRNTELVLPAPFDLSRISDSTVEAATLSARARLIKAGIPT